MQVFIAGIMQGSRLDHFIGVQDYRAIITQVLREHYPGVEIVDPNELHPSGVDYDDEKNTIMDSGFLMQQMELREAISEINGASDPYAAVEGIIEDIEQNIKTLHQKLREEFAKNKQADTEFLADKIRKLQFFEKLRDEAEAVEADLDS